jgi:hypothetical protein
MVLQGITWTNVRLDDGREGWVEGECREGIGDVGVRSSGNTSRLYHIFGREDCRAFFLAGHESSPRRGFLLAAVGYSNDTGRLGQFWFTDKTWGEIVLKTQSIRHIEINRRKDGPPVLVKTDTREYRGDFGWPKQHPSANSLYLVVTTPFVCLGDLASEINLVKIEYAVLERV